MVLESRMCVWGKALKRGAALDFLRVRGLGGQVVGSVTLLDSVARLRVPPPPRHELH